MHTQETTDTLTALMVLLDAHSTTKPDIKPEDNPYQHHTLVQLSHGLMKGADNIPAVNMAAKAPDDPAAFALESERFAFAAKGKEDKSARRMAKAKSRAERKVEFDKIANSPVAPDPVRLEMAWLVVHPMVPIVNKIAKSKQRWANRLLGSNADDIPQVALERMALVLARQEKFPLPVLRTAALELAASEAGIPGNQEVDENDPDERKQVRKARKWLMGMANNRVMGALVDSYTEARNLKWENLDLIATVMASINGTGDDPMVARFKADRAPAFLGTRFQRPGGIDPNLLAQAISGAITDRGLDPLVEFLLDEANTRPGDNAVEWTKHARTIFLLTPGGTGTWLWDQVCGATANHANPRKSRGEAAMKHVRNLFLWMPSLIVNTVESFDPHFIGWSTQSHRAILASDFELFYLPDPNMERLALTPTLRFADSAEAALALTEYLACLTTGADLVASARNA